MNVLQSHVHMSVTRYLRKSDGLILFSFLDSSSSSSVDTSSFVCVAILSLCLMVNDVISSLIVGIYIYIYIYIYIGKCKGKVIPLPAQYGPEGG